MKGKRPKYRLSPNEEAQILKEETEKRRRLRLQQVREQSKQNAARIRQAVKDEQNRQLQKMAADVQDQLEKEKQERIRHLESQYHNSLKSIGQGQKEALQQIDVEEERYFMQLEDNKRADARFKMAIERERREKMFKDHEQKYHIVARHAALEVEKERATKIASLPAPPPDPLLLLESNTRRPVKMTDIDNFTTTHYHLQEDYTVDKADPTKQVDGKKAAEDEQIKIDEKHKELIQLKNDRQTRAVVRHNAALEKELLYHDYGRILHDLSDLQRADRDQRQKVVANIPKQVFEPPHRRLEDKEERQKDLEEAFEDMYMADTNYLGDLSLALDPHPPADSTTVTESPDISTHPEGTPLREPTLNNIPSVLRDTTNLPKEGEITIQKKPEKVLRKLMDRIKSQRQEWMSKSLQETGEPGLKSKDQDFVEPKKTSQDDSRVPALSEYSLSETGSPDPTAIPVKPGKDSVHKHVNDEVKQPRTASGETMQPQHKIQSTDGNSIDLLLKQQNEIDPLLKLMEVGTKAMEQKRELESKLRELEERQRMLNQTASSHSSDPAQNQPSYPPTSSVPPVVNGYQSTSQPPPQPVPVVNGFPSHMPPSHFYTGVPPYASQVNGYVGQPVPVPGSYPPHMPIGSRVASVPQINGVGIMEPPSVNYYGSVPHIAPGFQQTFPQSAYPNSSADMFKPPRLAPGQFTSTVSGDVPRTFLTPSLPIPSTVAMSIPSSQDKPSDHLKKVKEYQLSLLQKHEQSKKVLAETRAEIERRRQQLLERFPQLQLKPLDSDTSGSNSAVDVRVEEVQKDPRLLTEGSLSPNKAAMSSLLSQLASQPYYVSRLSQAQEGEQSKTEDLYPAQGTENNTKLGSSDRKLDNVRKSLPFDADDTIHATPNVSRHDKPGYGLSPGSTTDDLDDTVMTSSTERGSPALAGGRHSSYTTGTESEQDKSLISQSKERNDFFERRQAELKQQLEEIQRQKEEILHRHQVGHLRLQQTTEPRQQQKETPTLVRTCESEGESTETDSGSEQSPMSSVYTVGRKGVHVLEQHQPHQLSTIQEVDSPTSTRQSSHAMSGRPSLSSSDRSSVSRTSVEALQPATIPEEAEDMVTSRAKPPAPAADTGYHTAHIEEAMARAAEFNPEILTNLRKQTNDVFYSLKEDDSVDSSHKHSMLSLSTGPVTPDSFSTGPLEGRETSGATFNSYNSPASDSSAMKSAKPLKQNTSTDNSVQSGMSWAEELASYNNGQSKSLPSERASYGDTSTTSFQPMKQSMESSTGPVDASADRSYKVLHFTPREEETSKVENKSSDADSFHHKPRSPSDMRASELSQYPLSSEESPQSNKSGSGKVSPMESSQSYSNKDADLPPSLASTMTESIQSCASSYMDIKVDNGVLSSREFDFIGKARMPQVKTDESESHEQTGTFEGSLEYTSTPNLKGGQTKSSRLSQVSQYTISPEESKIQAGSTNFPQSQFGQFTHVKPQPDHSFGVVSDQRQAFTRVSGPGFLSRVSEERDSMDSGKSVHSTTKEMTKLREDSSLSQFSITDPSSTELSLTQITLEQMSPDKSKQNFQSLSQYTIKSSPESSGKDNSSLSQYSMDSSHKQSDTNNSNIQGLSALSGFSNGESQEEDDSYVQKKFANLDQLIRESKHLITKHKAMIDKNKSYEPSSDDSPPPLPKSTPPIIRQTMDDVDTGSSVHSDSPGGGLSYGGSSQQLDQEMSSQLTEPSHLQELERLGQESGITDEPDMTLVTLSSTHDASQLGEITHRSEESTASDSILSFEQHERSMLSTPDQEFMDNFDAPRARLSYMKSYRMFPKMSVATYKERQSKDLASPSKPVERDAGDENVFRAVPAMVSPTLAFSTKFNSNQQEFTKPPVSWSYGDDDDKRQSTKLDTKSGDKPIVTKVVEHPNKPEPPKQKVLSADKSGLNKALLPRSSKPSSAPATSQSKESRKSATANQKPVSLGEFLSSSGKEGPSILGKRPAKQPPPVKPKPQRRSAGTTEVYNATATGPSMVVPTTSDLTKTLSSWKKSRVVRPGPAPPTQSRELPQSSAKASRDSLSKANEDKPYEHHMRAYNPRLFRLQNRIEEGQLTKSKEDQKQKQTAAHREKVKEFQKTEKDAQILYMIDLKKIDKLQENMKRKQQMKEKKLQQQK